MLPFYDLRKKLGLADLSGRFARPQLSPLDLAIGKVATGTTTGEPLGDKELSQRIAQMYRSGVAAFPGYGESMWSAINVQAAAMHQSLMSDDVDAITTALDNPHTTNVFLGFDIPVVAPFRFDGEDRNLLSIEIGPGSKARIYRALKRLAEAVGAVEIANPETLTGSALTPDEYLRLIDEKLGVELKFPNFYPMEPGIQTERGVISFRPFQAIYQAARLKQLGATKVLEIGAGLGRTAYYANLLGIASYTIVDIPMSNVTQAHFLSRALGNEKVGLPGDPERPVRIMGPSFVAGCAESFDVVLNVDSLSEMDQDVAQGYVEFTKRAGKVFVSINREWDGAPRTSSLLGDHRFTRYPYWMRDGYVEEIAVF